MISKKGEVNNVSEAVDKKQIFLAKFWEADTYRLCLAIWLRPCCLLLSSFTTSALERYKVTMNKNFESQPRDALYFV